MSFISSSIKITRSQIFSDCKLLYLAVKLPFELQGCTVPHLKDLCDILSYIYMRVSELKTSPFCFIKWVFSRFGYLSETGLPQTLTLYWLALVTSNIKVISLPSTTLAWTFLQNLMHSFYEPWLKSKQLSNLFWPWKFSNKKLFAMQYKYGWVS